MREADLPQVMDIEETVFTGDPWPRSAFHRQLDNSLAQFAVLELRNAGSPAEQPGKVLGYAGTWIIVDEAHVMNIAIAPGYQGQGLGEYLLLIILGSMRLLGATVCTLEVRASNRRAQNLYRRLGFQVEGRRRHYYVDNGEDALIMTTPDLATLQPLHDERLAAVRHQLLSTYNLQLDNALPLC